MQASRIDTLNQYLNENPDDCFLNHAMALELIKAGDEPGAEQRFRKNRAHDPGYVATYYHLGRLLERKGENDEAMSVYSEGMERAKAAGDQHQYNELQAAYEDLAY